MSYEYIVIGAGPAALQLGYYFERESKKYLLLERGESAGTAFEKFPRHRTLISINKIHTGHSDPEINMRWDWNSLLSDDYGKVFSEFSKDYFPGADDMVEYLNSYAEFYNINVKYDVDVRKVDKNEGRFRLYDQGGDILECEKLIVATGVSKPYQPDIPGVEEAKNYVDVSVNPSDFVNKSVLIIGKGNSAFETADNLVGTASVIHLASPSSVRFAWKTHFVGDLRAVNNNVLDTYQLKSQNAILDATIRKIEKLDGKYHVDLAYSHANGEVETLVYDYVIVCAGFKFDASIFDDSCRPELAIKDKFPKLTSSWESTNVQGMFFCGTITQSLDYKKSTSGFIHGFRYNARALSRVLDAKFHDVPWPIRRIDLASEGIAELFLERINKTSALWQQFSFLRDVLIVSENGRHADYYEEVPANYLFDGNLGRHEHYYTLSFRFGDEREDPFNVKRMPVPEKAEQSFAIHPVITRHSYDREVAVHHLLEDLFGRWVRGVEHKVPLITFLEKQFRGDAALTH